MNRNGTKRAHSSRISDDHQSMVEVRGDVAAIRDDFGRLLKDLKDTGVRSLKDSATSASATLSQCVTKSKDAATVAHKQIGTTISKRPLTTLAIAIGAGAILGRMLRR